MKTRKDQNTVSINDNKSKYQDLIKFISYDKGFELIFHKSSIPKALSDITSKKFISVNKAWETFTGYKASEIIGKTTSEINIIDIGERNFIKEKLSKNENLKSYNAVLFVKNGQKKEVILSFDNVVYQGTNFVLSEILDISELKKSKDSLRAEKEFSENLIASMQEGLLVVTKDSKITSVNPSFCKMTGYSEEELIDSTTPYPFWAPEHYDTCFSFYDKLINENVYEPYETFYKRKDGERFPVHITTSQIKDKNDNIIALFATIQDITERRLAQEELYRAKEFSENLIYSLQEGLVVTDLKSEIIKVNPSFCKMLGYTEKELLGLKQPYPFSPPEIKNEVAIIANNKQEEFSGKFESMFVHKNGRRFPISILVSAIHDKKGNKIANFATVQDITHQKKLQNTQKEITEKSNKKKNTILALASLVGEDFTFALKKITSLAAKTLNVERVSVWSFNDDYTEIKCNELYKLTNEQFENGMVLNKKDNPEYFDALGKSKTLCISDTFNNPITKKFTKNYLEPFNVYAMMDVFINGIGGYYGIICFEHVDSIREWSAEEEEFATSIASLVSLMVQSRDRIIAESKLKELNEDLSKAVGELKELKSQLENENIYLRNELAMVFNFEEMVYGSADFSEVLSNVEKVAPSDATVLLLGDTGTGKELLARAIHNLSNRKEKPLIKLNCAAIPKELIESELFGHKKGSFTGAIQDKIGKIELADGGTLFLDEIGELPISMQPKLLRFLQEGEIETIGETKTKKVNVRVIAATNRNLKKDIKKKRFREDLYFRLNVFPIKIPALRNRKEDIPLLIEHFVDKFNKKYRKNIKYISDTALAELKEYNWPGNIRELENFVERAIILSNSEHLLLPEFNISKKTTTIPISSTNLSLDEAQRIHIIKILEKCNWKIDGENGASELLKIKPSTLRDRIKKLNISKPS